MLLKALPISACTWILLFSLELGFDTVSTDTFKRY